MSLASGSSNNIYISNIIRSRDSQDVAVLRNFMTNRRGVPLSIEDHVSILNAAFRRARGAVLYIRDIEIDFNILSTKMTPIIINNSRVRNAIELFKNAISYARLAASSVLENVKNLGGDFSSSGTQEFVDTERDVVECVFRVYSILVDITHNFEQISRILVNLETIERYENMRFTELNFILSRNTAITIESDLISELNRARGMTDSEINAFRRSVVEQDSDEKCPICIDEFKSKQETLVTGCNHMFHYNCLKTWLKNNKTCPTCREEFSNSGEPEENIVTMGNTY